MIDTIATRLAIVHDKIAAACERAERSVESVTLIAVSKTQPPEAILEAAQSGQVHFGENRAEEADEKIPIVEEALAKSLTWHMVGHVQSRKAESVAALFDKVHSLDSVKLAERYSRFALEFDHRLEVLLEVNISGEASKSGLIGARWATDSHIRESLWSDIRRMIELPGIHIGGLMTIAPIADDPEAVRPVFAALRNLRDALAADFPTGCSWDALSMGMTDDYTVAIEEGATLIRIGRAIFGERH